MCQYSPRSISIFDPLQQAVQMFQVRISMIKKKYWRLRLRCAFAFNKANCMLSNPPKSKLLSLNWEKQRRIAAKWKNMENRHYFLSVSKCGSPTAWYQPPINVLLHNCIGKTCSAWGQIELVQQGILTTNGLRLFILAKAAMRKLLTNRYSIIRWEVEAAEPFRAPRKFASFYYKHHEIGSRSVQATPR